MRKVKKAWDEHKYKVLVILGIIIVLVVLFVIIANQSPKRYTFEKGFRELEKIDEKYGAKFKLEQLNGTMVDYKKINPLIDEITIFREKITEIPREEWTRDEEALVLFTNARALMLLSQKNFILGKTIGSRGLVTDESFSCAEAGYIINAAYYYNLSWGAGILATRKLDDLLGHYKDVENLRDLVGIKKTRAKFYFSPLDYIKRQINFNTLALENYCYLNMTGGLRKVDPNTYAQLPEILREI